MPEPIETGGLPSPHDYRDDLAASAVPAALAAITVPATFDTPMGPDLYQRKTPSCVSHSAVEVLRLYYFKKTGRWINFSPRFLDTLVKRIDGLNPATDGTYPRLVFKLMAKYGCATEDTLPNDTTLPILQYRDDSKLTAAVMAEAAQYKVPGYVRIPLELTRQAIFLYGAVSTLVQIGKEWWTAPDGSGSWDDSKIDPLRVPQVVVSGHQVTPKGWLSDTLNKLRNHWSLAWANQDEAGYDPALWAPYTIEQWTIAEIPADVANFLKTLPAPADFHYSWQQNLHQGMAPNDDVKFAQIALMILGFLGPITADDLGYYGPKTAAAVSAYQKAHRISPVPWSIGPQTRGALNAEFAL